MAETTTITGLPVAAVRATRRAEARMRSAVASDEPPYFCTSTAERSDDDMGSLIGEGKRQSYPSDAQIVGGHLECPCNGGDLRRSRAQRQNGRPRARYERTQRTGLHGRTQKRSASGKQWQTERLVEAIAGRFSQQVE